MTGHIFNSNYDSKINWTQRGLWVCLALGLLSQVEHWLEQRHLGSWSLTRAGHVTSWPSLGGKIFQMLWSSLIRIWLHSPIPFKEIQDQQTFYYLLFFSSPLQKIRDQHGFTEPPCLRFHSMRVKALSHLELQVFKALSQFFSLPLQSSHPCLLEAASEAQEVHSTAVGFLKASKIRLLCHFQHLSFV